MPKHVIAAWVRKMRVNWLESKCDTLLPIICLSSAAAAALPAHSPGIDRVQKLLLMFLVHFLPGIRRNCSSNCCSISNVDISLSLSASIALKHRAKWRDTIYRVAQFVGDTIATKML